MQFDVSMHGSAQPGGRTERLLGGRRSLGRGMSAWSAGGLQAVWLGWEGCQAEVEWQLGPAACCRRAESRGNCVPCCHRSFIQPRLALLQLLLGSSYICCALAGSNGETAVLAASLRLLVAPAASRQLATASAG